MTTLHCTTVQELIQALQSIVADEPNATWQGGGDDGDMSVYLPDQNISVFIEPR